MEQVLQEIREERLRQNAKWGEQNHDYPTWRVILDEETGEASNAFLEEDWDNFRVELVQCAAVMVQMIECWDRKNNDPTKLRKMQRIK